MRPVLYVDMDGVLVDVHAQVLKHYGQEGIDNIGTILDGDAEMFRLAEPMPGAVEAFNKLNEKFNVYILSTAPWELPEVWKIKREWVEKHLGDVAYKKLILSNNKGLMIGDYLIDDRTANGASEFVGQHIQFGQPGVEDWNQVLNHLNL